MPLLGLLNLDHLARGLVYHPASSKWLREVHGDAAGAVTSAAAQLRSLITATRTSLGDSLTSVASPSLQESTFSSSLVDVGSP